MNYCSKEPNWLTPRRFGLILLVGLLAAFPKVLLGIGSFFFRDYGVLGYPFIYYHHESFWRGELPLWNPLSNCGAPFLAQWGTMTLYPFSIIYLLFPLPWSLTYFCFGHLVLGAFGMYFLARRWTGNHFGCGLAGLAYVFNGVTFSCLLWPNYAVAMGWMPWVILWTERSWRQGGGWLVVACLAAAMQMLSGVPEVVLFTWIILGVLWCEALVHGEIKRWHLVRRAGLVVVLAAGLSAIQLLPFLDMLAHSQRDRAWSNTKWPMPPWGWANLFVPLFHCFQSFQGPFFQYGQEFLTSYYPGVTVVLLAWLGFSNARKGRAWILAGLILFGFVMALGDSGYLFTWVKKIFPLMNVARFPVKFVILAAFCIPLLAACKWQGDEQQDRKSVVLPSTVLLLLICGVLWFAKSYPFPYDHWTLTLKNGVGRALWLVVGVGVLLALQRVSNAKSKQLLQLGLLAIIIGDALTHTVEQNPVAPTDVMAPGFWKEFNSNEAPKPGESRLMISPQAEAMLLSSVDPSATSDFIAKRRALWSNLNILEDVPKVNGSSTLQIKEQKKVEELLYQQTNSMPEGLLSFLGVSHYTSPKFAIEFTERTNHNALTTAGQTPVFLSPEETLKRLVANDFKPLEVVYLPLEAQGKIKTQKAASAKVIAKSFSAKSIQVEAEADSATMLVVAQSFHPGWQATVDGKPVPLWKANYAFQALELPQGRHLVQLRYREPLLGIGTAITGVSLGVCLMLFLLHPKRKPQQGLESREREPETLSEPALSFRNAGGA
ncbi:MAG: hypothetical protein JWM16_3121 [Verrucomicrobiales bacterium]|nr:hypothetical protein [Verrucomicrobiales bacterium]